MAQMMFGRDQQQAIVMATDWLRTKSMHVPVFVVGGYAGTGKSTVLKQVLANMGIPMYKVAFATYTGKAAVVLRQKGMNAYTLHKLVYNVSVGSSGTPIFRKKPRLPGNIELICIDELGMVPQEIMDDLVSYGIPILGLGDPGQLPPIYGENKYITNPDVFLFEVFRQSSDSSLLQIATDIRSGVDPFTQKYSSDVTIVPLSKFDSTTLLDYDQILCSTNKNKTVLNVKCRSLRNMAKPLPFAGEKIICGLNNFKDIIPYDGVDMYLVNGLTGISTSDALEVTDDVIYLRFKPDCMNHDIPIYCRRSQFMENYEDLGIKNDEASHKQVVEFYDNKVINSFNYGYAITTHKSQGSEWGNVLVYDDCFYKDEANYRRWLYTSVTRARQKVTIIRSDF